MSGVTVISNWLYQTSILQPDNIDGLMQDCSNFSALAMALLQSCTKLSIYENCNR